MLHIRRSSKQEGQRALRLTFSRFSRATIYRDDGFDSSVPKGVCYFAGPGISNLPSASKFLGKFVKLSGLVSRPHHAANVAQPPAVMSHLVWISCPSCLRLETF